jgi:hypothetical protein
MAKNITCTRCLGKGYVDNKDLKRLSRGLNRVSEWDENSDCRFCGGKGKISEKFASKHNPDSEEFPNVEDYSGLINFSNLSEEEKDKRFEEALERAGGDINFDEEDDNEETDINLHNEVNVNVENDSKIKKQAESIFWWTVLFFFVLVLLFIPIYQHKKIIDYYSSLQGAVSFPLIITIFMFPTLFLYCNLFGKIEITDADKEKSKNLFIFLGVAFYMSVMMWIIGVITGIMKLINTQFLEEFYQHPIIIGIMCVLTLVLGNYFNKKIFK